MLDQLVHLRNAQTGRASSWEETGRNSDAWWDRTRRERSPRRHQRPRPHHPPVADPIQPLPRVLAQDHLGRRRFPSVVCPLGDFFGLGHGIVNSYQSLLFSARRAATMFLTPAAPSTRTRKCPSANAPSSSWSTKAANGTASISTSITRPATYRTKPGTSTQSSAAENPFGGWGHEIRVNSPEANIVNKGQTAWDNNYVILETQGAATTSAATSASPTSRALGGARATT